MKLERGGIYLVDFGVRYQAERSGLGKIRPALVWQNDLINAHLDAAPFPSVIVIPCTTDLKGGRFRVRLHARDRLERESELIVPWICSVDLGRFVEAEALTFLDEEEAKEFREKLDFVMGYGWNGFSEREV
ncbi:type II toxin-antitoxin system PemK/MazF family toxin [Hydrogenimonas sp.]